MPAEMTARWGEDLPVLWRLLRGKPTRQSAADALDAFYGPQAHAYDRFRERLLSGRRELMHALPLTSGSRVLDLGGGTGGHWSYVENQIDRLARLDIVDLCEPLLAVARRRFANRPHVHVQLADAERFTSPERFDVVLFSYSLSMMSRWRDALSVARGHLAPGGTLAIIDFHTLPATPPDGAVALSGWDRAFWPRWFRHDGVYLDAEVVPTLLGSFRTTLLVQERSKIPYLAGLRAPWFMWMGT
ncbi:MAG TPA: class I SAM-dependent methyltransferase [Gemmatimonadaceae bacterium]|nr:class I SAM-dependent methyltransferase [Gemmatimonadaceae bacterium]